MILRGLLYFFILITVFSPSGAAAQAVLEETARWGEGNALLAKKDFAEAAAVFQELGKSFPSSAPLKYNLGICYLNSDNLKPEAVPYFEYVLKYGESFKPKLLNYYLGRAYHIAERLEAAIYCLNIFVQESGAEKEMLDDAKRYITQVVNAQDLIRKKLQNYSVANAAFPVSTSYKDYAPVVFEGGKAIFYSSDRPTNDLNLTFEPNFSSNPKKQGENIFRSRLESSGWTGFELSPFEDKVAYPLSLTNNNITALLFMGQSEEEGDIYIAKFKDDKWGKPKKLPVSINSRYQEKGACLSENGRAIYFASNRPGGFGGFDLYKIEADDNEVWGVPENLGEAVNTEYDEITPNLHPDNKTLYYSSNGVKSMGGFDIFTTAAKDGFWNEPINVGYPINSVFDDMQFSALAGDRLYYFASNRYAGLGDYDIYQVKSFESKTTHAMVKGTISVTMDGDTIPVKLKVEDSRANTYTQYIYNPDVAYGNKYFMILPPNKSYWLDILPDSGSKAPPHRVLLSLPINTFYYEMDKRLAYKSVKLLGQEIGVEKTEQTTFFDVKTSYEQEVDTADIRFMIINSLIENIVERVDKEGLENLKQLEKTNFYTEKDQDESYFDNLMDFADSAVETANMGIFPILSIPDKEEKVSLQSKNKIAFQKNFVFNGQKKGLSDSEAKDLEEIIEFLKKKPEMLLEFQTSKKMGATDAENTAAAKENTALLKQIMLRGGIPENRLAGTAKEGLGFVGVNLLIYVKK